MLRVFVISLLICVSTVSSHAREFGNIFGSEATERASTDASVEALSALMRIIEGIRLRELQKASGIDQFVAAAEQLRNAANIMNSVLESEFDNSEFSDENKALVSALFETSSFGQLGELPINPRQLYQYFQSMTESFAAIIEESATENMDVAVYPNISEYINDYLDCAALVTQLSPR
ncbi:MAG: hypothetical protein JJ913_16710 [Rhizobiaceae bacterium]|nr:hypothetical protein [Rhizobiaceae bacterium]